MIEIGTLVRINPEGYYNIDMVGVSDRRLWYRCR
jgi:hypothetical protein